MAKARQAARTIVDVLRGLLPSPVQEGPAEGGVVLTGGDPELVAVRVSNGGVSVAVFGIRWDGPHSPTRADRELCALT
jgi:hypothetical protein